MLSMRRRFSLWGSRTVLVTSRPHVSPLPNVGQGSAGPPPIAPAGKPDSVIAEAVGEQEWMGEGRVGGDLGVC